MSIDEQTVSRPRVLILGATGRIGSKVIAELERINIVRVVYSSRKIAQVEAWRRELPSFVEPTCGASILEWVRQIYDGRLNFRGPTTDVEDLTGRKPQTLENWVRTNRQVVLSAGS